MRIRAATPQDVPHVLTLLDEIFVHTKGRVLSMSRRFPDIYNPANAHNILLAIEESEILALLVIKQFDWSNETQAWQGAMIGGICTRPAYRGRGLASALVQHAVTALRTREADFAVLWTAIPEFYRRLGWVSTDISVLGEFTTNHDVHAPVSEDSFLPEATDLSRVEQVRAAKSRFFIKRSNDYYQRVPSPAEAVKLIFTDAPLLNAYALVGERLADGFIYEMYGDDEDIAALWNKISCRYQHIVINESENSPTHRWLLEHGAVNWRNNPLTMWFALSETKKIDFSQWYIPYFDRI